MRLGETTWLRGAPLAWAAFTLLRGERVRVLAIIGATERIDRDMPAEEAREIWRRLRAQEWAKRTNREAEAEGMDMARLRLLAYD